MRRCLPVSLFVLVAINSLICRADELAPKGIDVDLSSFATYQIFPEGKSFAAIRAAAGATEPTIEFSLPNRPLGKVFLRPGEKLSLMLEPERRVRGRDFVDSLEDLEDDRLLAFYYRGIGVSKRELSKLGRFQDMKWLGLDCINLDTKQLAMTFPGLERLELICWDTGAPEGAFPGDSFTGAAIASFKQFKNLKGLRWGNYQIDQRDLRELATLDQLRSLELWPLTPMDDEEVEIVASMKNVVELVLYVGPKCTAGNVVSLQRIKTLKHLTIRTSGFETDEAGQLFRSQIRGHEWEGVELKVF